MAVGAVTVGAAGGLLGALADTGLSKEHAHVYSEAVRRGGTLLSARVEDRDVETARAILDRRGPIDPDIRRSEYKSAGWSEFDPTAAPYRPSAEELERIRRMP